jgi:hypothetical protein
VYIGPNALKGANEIILFKDCVSFGPKIIFSQKGKIK